MCVYIYNAHILAGTECMCVYIYNVWELLQISSIYDPHAEHAQGRDFNLTVELLTISFPQWVLFLVLWTTEEKPV